jgi:hypothetical protein
MRKDIMIECRVFLNTDIPTCINAGPTVNSNPTIGYFFQKRDMNTGKNRIFAHSL